MQVFNNSRADLLHNLLWNCCTVCLFAQNVVQQIKNKSK